MAFQEVLAKYSKQLTEFSQRAFDVDQIANELYEKHKVFRGLRDKMGVGVVAGLTEISEMNGAKKKENGERVLIDGEMYYRGIDIYTLVDGIGKENRFGFEETAFLLLCGALPTKEELEAFCELLSAFRVMPDNFVRDVVLKAPPKDMMNALSKCILTLYSYDENPEDTSIENVFRQCIQLIAITPMLAVYSYQAYIYQHKGENLHIRNPKPGLSTSENVLYLLKGDNYTRTQAKILDLCLILQAEHGGGNNSTFTTHVVTSSGTDTYSCMAASLGSLKGPKHGGANLKVSEMMQDILANVDDITDENVSAYLTKILDKEAFDKLGLIYGLGHAIYSVSDPRAVILERAVQKYMEDKEETREYKLYKKVKDLAQVVINANKKIYKGVCVNIDYHSGFIYDLLGIPQELFTPIFAMSRIAGWSAHRLEELANKGKIIRPAYIAVSPRLEYVPLEER